MSETQTQDTIQFVGYYQTPLNAGTYKIESTLTAPAILQQAPDLSASITKTVKLHVAGPRFFLPPLEIHSVFPPENGAGDYNNILPHVVLNRPTLPWERLVNTSAPETEDIPFLAVLVFCEEEEISGDVTPPTAITLDELLASQNLSLELGEKLTDKVNVIDVKPVLLQHIMPTGEELRLLAHGREKEQGETSHKRAVVIANRLPAPPINGNGQRRNIAHLVMLENRYTYNNKNTWTFSKPGNSDSPVRLVCLKSWQFTCTTDKPTLRGRLLSDAFTFEPLCVPKPTNGDTEFEPIRQMSYAALPYHLRWGDRAHTLYHGPLVASASSGEGLAKDYIPTSSDSLMRILKDHQIFDVSLAAAWQLGRLLMLQDQGVAMEYFRWRHRDTQIRARQTQWNDDGHLQLEDDFSIKLTEMPATVIDWFQQHLALNGLPFEYLVPDVRMVPEHSLRFFRIHTGWMDSFISGALAVGRGGEGDRLREADYRSMVYGDSERGDRTGFLLRSPAVDEHPDLQVTVFDKGGSTPSDIRLERLGPGLLLGLYNGTLAKLQFSLPSIGLHFGLKESEASDGSKTFSKDLRKEDGTENNKTVDVPMKEFPNHLNLGGSVIDINLLSQAIQKELNHTEMTTGEFAFQMCEGREMVDYKLDSDP